MRPTDGGWAASLRRSLTAAGPTPLVCCRDGTGHARTCAGPTLAAMSTPRHGSRPFDITAGAAIKLGFFAALGAAVFSLALTVVAGAIGLLLALLFGTSLLGLLDR